MKSFLFASISILICTGFSPDVSAQFRKHKKKEKREQSADPAFISDVVIYPGISSGGGTSVSEKGGVKNAKTASVRIIADANARPDYQSFQFKYGQLLNRDIESITNANLFGFIDEWWETPYRYGGTTHKGIDCSAFSSTLLSAVYGMEIPRTARDQYSFCKKIGEDELEEGDLLFFNTRGGVSHVGVSLGGKYFVHASTSSGVTISSLDEDYYRRRFIAGGRISTSQYAQSTSSVTR